MTDLTPAQAANCITALLAATENRKCVENDSQVEGLIWD